MNFRQSEKLQGTISVFFSLILLIVLSFVLTVVEGARINSAQLLTQQALLVSMDSILAEYYRPLWDEYHIFGLEGPLDEISNRMETYINDQINPTDTILGYESKKGIDLYELEINQIQAENSVMLTDYDGELFLYQSSEFMKYKVIGAGVETILDRMSLMETPKKVSIIYEEKVQVEENLSKIDQGVLKLMELLDGIKTSKKGIVITSDGGISVNASFIKKICMSEVTQSNIAINQSEVFQVLKDQYYNPLQDMNGTEEKIYFIQSNENENYNYRTKIQYHNQQIMNYRREIEVLNRKEKTTKQDDERIRTLEGLIKDLQEKSNTLSKKIYDNDISISEYKSQAMEASQSIRNAVQSILPLYQDAFVVLNEIIKQQGLSKIEVGELEQLIKDEKGGLEENIYQSLLDELNQMKRYVGDGIMGYDFGRMKEILSENQRVLSSFQTSVDEVIVFLEQNELNKALQQITVGKEVMNGYKISQLAIDYSTLLIEPQQKSSLKAMKQLMEESLYQLVIDQEEVSKKTLSNELLPSTAIDKEISPTSFSLSIFFSEILKDQSASQLSELFQGVNSQESSILDGVGLMVNQLGKLLLYQEYYKEHFYDYSTPREEESSQKPSALNYEREYLLFGNQGDKDNLWSMINHILLSRVMFNFISLLKDKSSCTEANIMAAAIVGFTGLPILVNITKIMILLVWSFGESLVDTTALLQGQKVAIIKNKLSMSLSELLFISPSYIKEKAKGITKTAKGDGISMGYDEYLYVLLLTRDSNKVSYLAMDLIQENLRIRYDENFKINQCLYGFTGKVTYIMPTKYTALINSNYILKGNKGYTIIKQAHNSY